MTEENILTQNHTVSGLAKLHAEIAGSIQELQNEIDAKLKTLASIGDLLKHLAPDLKLDTIKPKRTRASRSTVGTTSFILDTLRETEKPLTARNIGLKLVAARGQAIDNKATVNKAVGQVSATLINLRKAGYVEASKTPGQPQVFQLI